MLLGLFDPVLLLVAAPILLYFVCLGVALAGLFPPRNPNQPRSTQPQTQAKTSLRRYAAWRPEPAGGKVWLSRPSRIARGIQWVRQRFGRPRETAVADGLAPNTAFGAREPELVEQGIEPPSKAAFRSASRAQEGSKHGATPLRRTLVRLYLPIATDRDAS